MWRPAPSATQCCGPGATSPTASATRCCEASPASRQRSPSLVIVGIVYEVIHIASPAISAFGIGFVTTNDWNPVTENFGAAPFIYGTVVTSAIALLFAAPLSIAISIFLTELAPSRLRRPVATLVDMLAAIPTVILGLWGILVLGPFMHDTIEPALQSVLGFLPIFSGDPSAFGYLTAAVILTIMVTPIITSVTREVFETVPGDLKEGAYALGATRWEMVREVVLPYSRAGHRRRLDPRPRPGDRRGDRGRPGDRRRHRDQRLPLPHRRHDGGPDRGPVPGRAGRAAEALARLPRPDPARLRRRSSTSIARLIVQRGTLKDSDVTPTEAEAL